MTDNTHRQVPEALLHASYLESIFVSEEMSSSRARRIAKELRRLHAYCQELEAQAILDCMTHVEKPAEIEHVAGDVSKNGAESNMSAQQPAPTTQQAPQQEAQQPCPTCAALARTVMLDQASFDRKPDCYGIRQITDDEAVEEWEDIRTSPDVAREEANDMMATGRGEIYEVVPLWTTPQPSPTAQAAESVTAPAGGVVAGMSETVQFSDKSKAPPLEKALRYLKAMGDQRTNSAYFFDDGYPRRESAQDALATLAVLEQLAPTPPAQTADGVLEDAARLDWLDQQCEAYGFQDIHEGNRWEISGAYANVRKAIDAARKQGGKP